MNEYEDIWAQDDVADTAYVARSKVPTAIYQTVTAKTPPLYDGRSFWFAYEEAIDDWCDITELEPEKRGPALRNRLEGEAAIYKSLLDRERLRNAEDGVNYFKRELIPHFVKGNQSVFRWRFSTRPCKPRTTRTFALDRTLSSPDKEAYGCMDGLT